MRRLAAGQVDEVGLADGLCGAQDRRRGPVADEDRLDLGAEGRRNARRPSPPSAGRRPRRPDRRRSAGSRRAVATRPVAASRLASNSDIVGRNSPAPTSATGPGIAPRVYLRHCRDDVAAALDPRRDDHRVGRGLPRRHGRQRRVAADRSRVARDAGRRPRGADLRHQRLPRRACRPADPGRRALRSLRSAPGLRHRSRGLRADIRRCAAWRRPSRCWSSRDSSRARRARSWSRARFDHHADVPGTRARPSVRPVDVGDLGAVARRTAAGRPAGRHDRLARRLPDQRADPAPSRLRDHAPSRGRESG